MNATAAPVAATRPVSARPRTPLAKLSRTGEGHSAAAAQLHRILPGGDQGLEVAAFGSSI